jgi:hypothetical protein
MKSKRPYQARFFCHLAILAFFMVLLSGPVAAQQMEVFLSSGQTVYVPVYSHIYSGVKGRPFDLTATLSIRNTDPQNTILITAAEYYDSDGKLVHDYLDAQVALQPLQTTRYIVAEQDRRGGSGANFIVKWKASLKVNPPIIEAVMIGTRSGQGISFISRGQVIHE